MANAVKTKLQKLSGQYSAKIAEKRKLEAEKRKPFITDAEVKTINEQIKAIEREYKAINADYNELSRVAKDAEEYIKLNDKLKTLESSIAQAEARGEDTTTFKQERNAAFSKLKVIAPEVERSFPEIKVAPPKISTGTTAVKSIVKGGAPTGTPATAPSTKGVLGQKPSTKTQTGTAQTGGPKGQTTPSAAYTTKQAADLAATVGGTNYFGAKYGSATDANAAADATGAATPLETLLAKTEFWYDLPDYIFKVDPKLGELLVEAVKNNWDNEKFLAKAKLTPWWQKNADSVRVRIIDREKYNDLRAAGEDVSKTEYGLYLAKQMRAVKAKAQELANVTLTDEQAQSIAQKIYDGFLDDDPLAINALIIPFIGKVTSIAGTGVGGAGGAGGGGVAGGTSLTGFGGQALKDYQTLQAIAKANGFTLKDILPNVSALTAGGDLETAVLRALASGTLDINRIAQDARMLAAQGQPQYVRGLLGQGYDLQDIYAPYRNQMAVTLELQPDEIDLNDPTLRMAITDKGDMNLFEFKKALRQDSRWQYTGGAREQVSSAALGVLKDFGFQG